MQSEEDNIVECNDKDSLKDKETNGYGGTENISTDQDEERKLSLNSAYELIGLGTFQYIHWATVFLASFTAHCVVTTLAIILPSLRCEWDLSTNFEALIVTIPLLSSGISSALLSKISDIYGRKPVLIFVYMSVSILVIISAASPSKWFFLSTRILLGLFNGIGKSPLVCYGIEFVESRFREYGIVVQLAANEGGMVAINGVAWLLLLTVGWRWFMVIMILPALPTLILLVILPDSPRYLAVSGKEEKASKSIQFMAKLNKADMPENIKIVCYENTQLGSSKELLSTHLRSIVLLCVIVTSLLFIQVGMTVFLPLLYSSAHCGTNSTLPDHGCVPLEKQDLSKLTVTSVFGLCGTFVALLIVVRVGRLIPLRAGYSALTLSMAALCFCLDEKVTFATTVVVKAVAGFLLTILLIMTPESFPTKIRSTAGGVILATGKIGATLANASVYLLFFVHPLALIGLFFAMSAFGLIASFVHKHETRDIVLQET